MNKNINIVWIIIVTLLSTNLSGITEQERIMIGANLQLFLKTLIDKDHVFVFESNPDEPLFDLRGVDLSPETLKTLIVLQNVSDKDLFRGSTITNVNLSGANLSGAKITSATLTNVNLTGAKLLNTTANRTHFWQCNLTGADFTKANMSGVQIIGEPGHPVQAKNLVAVGANISSSSLLFYVDLSGANMAECDFQNSTLSYITVNDQTSFKNALFSMAQLDNWNGYRGDLRLWLLGQTSNEKLLADTSINGLNTRISQN